MRLAWLVSVLFAHCLSANIPEGYQLVWADEFDQDGRPDPKKWTYETGFQRNHELQWYQPDNAHVEGGRLIIEGRRERKPNPDHKPDGDWRQQRTHAEYTSACLITKDLHSWQYGLFEIRAKIRAEEGLWPAIWTLGIEGEWPSNGEVDIMEFYGGNILANACWAKAKRWTPRWDASRTAVDSFGQADWDAHFHTWRMLWDEKQIVLSLDGQILNTIDLTQTINQGKRGPRNPFHQPHYLLLNLAIGGNAGGDPSGTAFPTRYEIDYVRIYQKP